MRSLLADRRDRVFERLYRRHAAEVHRYALGVMRNAADAEDVTQTTFLNAYRALLRGERPRTPVNWLIAIAHNVCRERMRQSSRRPIEVELDESTQEMVREEVPWTADEIRRAVSQLSPNQRAAVVLRELEGRPYAEIAKALQVSIPAVEALVFRARRALREQLEGSLSCQEAEEAVARQLEGHLPRPQRSALRAHLRECRRCAALARRARGGSRVLRGLPAVPLPFPLPIKWLFGGGSGAASSAGGTVGGGVTVKAAAVAATGIVAAGVGYEGAHYVQTSVRPDQADAARLAPAPSSPSAVRPERLREETARATQHRARIRPAPLEQRHRTSERAKAEAPTRTPVPSDESHAVSRAGHTEPVEADSTLSPSSAPEAEPAQEAPDETVAADGGNGKANERGNGNANGQANGNGNSNANGNGSATGNTNPNANANANGHSQSNGNGRTEVKPEPSAHQPPANGRGRAEAPPAAQPAQAVESQRSATTAEPEPTPHGQNEHAANR